MTTPVRAWQRPRKPLAATKSVAGPTRASRGRRSLDTAPKSAVCSRGRTSCRCSCGLANPWASPADDAARRRRVPGSASSGTNCGLQRALTARWRSPLRRPATPSRRLGESICGSRSATTISSARAGARGGHSLPDTAVERLAAPARRSTAGHRLRWPRGPPGRRPVARVHPAVPGSRGWHILGGNIDRRRRRSVPGHEFG